jgi:hypothetical protein
MRALWRAVSTGSTSAAERAFFPRPAYLQVKAIPDAGSDWQYRLLEDFKLDLAAAHAMLGQGAHGTRLKEVVVPQSYAHWVAPGACYNRTGYWEVPNARVVYLERGQERSFGIASMISWRGIWYVVHLGGVVRLAVGMVDDPSAGVGVSVNTGTC